MTCSIWFQVFFLLLMATSANLEDPYKILSVERHATQQEIRRAYRQLAKEWHPDKSDNPEAEKKFVEIKQAYELLSDSERRKAYDIHGITNEDATIFRESHDYTSYGRFPPDPFEEFFGHRFHFDQDISLFHKLSITTKYFETNILPKSQITPYLIMFYSDWCFACMKAVSAFKKLIDILEPLGTNFATINSGHENGLVRRLNVHAIPCIVLILDNKFYVYKESIFSVQRIVDFLRHKLPYKLVPTVKDDNIQDFLSGWNDNRVRALVMEPRGQPRLRYLLCAFHFRVHVAFAFVELNSFNTETIKDRYKVHPNLDTVLIFNEDTIRPVASVSMADIPLQMLNNAISANQYLALPRLSSQGMLEGVCPTEWNRPRKRLCVILVTENTNSHDNARQSLRKIALESSYSTERVRFAYIYKETQSEFINALVTEDNQETLLRVVIIWRRDTKHVKYEWVDEARLHIYQMNNTADFNYNHTKKKLDDTIQRLLRASEALRYEAEVKDLLDEHTHGIVSQIFNKIFMAFEYLLDNLGHEHILPALSVLGTVGFILGVGYLMAYLVRQEEENIKKQQKDYIANNNNGLTKSKTNYVPELRLHELRAEKYNGLVRLLKPGCRTIVLVTDQQSRSKLIPGYHKALWPYRKNKTLMFAHMLIDKGLTWYTELLRLSLTEARDIKINPRNCIGTIIALNGHRKYFCMYHAKHPETNRGAKRMLKMAQQLSNNYRDPEAGSFLTMDSESDSSVSTESEPRILLEENLLDGLSNWLDRLFEGTTHRYYINYWPDFPTK